MKDQIEFTENVVWQRHLTNNSPSAALESINISDARFEVYRCRGQGERFRYSGSAPCERQAKQALFRCKTLYNLKELPPLRGVEVLATAGLSKQVSGSARFAHVRLD